MLTTNQSIKCWAEDDRPREKFVLKGSKSLSNAELLAIIINSGTKSKSALDLSKELLQFHNNSILELLRVSQQDLCKFKGIGPAKAISILSVLELIKRTSSEITPSKQSLKSSRVVYEFLKPFLLHLSHEEFYVIYLNRANEVIQCKQISIGGMTGTVVDQRLIFKFGIQCSATSIILAHNHPSGQLNPSEQDKKITKKLVEIGLLMEINVLDHLIFTDNDYFSFADNGMI